MTSEDQSNEPERVPLFLTIPPIALWLAMAVGASEVLFLGAEFGLWGGPDALSWRSIGTQTYGYSSPVLERMISLGHFSWDKIIRPFSYPFVSSGWREALITFVITVGAGKYAAERMNVFPFVTLIVCTTVFGAFAFTLFTSETAVLTGGLSVAFGLLGFFAFWEAKKARYNGNSMLPAFRLPLFLLSIDIILTLVFGGVHFWVARAGALASGFVLGFLVNRKGEFSWTVLKKRLGRA
ncbi:MAG: rhomboid family intramembrane serine protease [Pseudomonadota bacterium]